MRKFFTKKLALTVTVASLLAVQVSGVAVHTQRSCDVSLYFVVFH